MMLCSVDPLQARDQLKKLLEENPPYNAKVEFDAQKGTRLAYCAFHCFCGQEELSI
jgi:hypothetical protein